MKKFAIVLSGCGVFDGSEIHEAVLSMLAVKRAGADYSLFAPNIPQHHVVNHLTGEEMLEQRNVLVESARIARGQIQDLKEYKPTDFDVLLLPGGFGAAKNLSDYAFKGAGMEVLPELSNAIKETYKLKKPIAAVCISPMILAKVLGLEQIQMTIGSDAETASHAESFGTKHQATQTGEILFDKEHRVFTAPCYMLNANITDIATETQKLVDEIMKSL